MPLTSTPRPYDPSWPAAYEHEAEKLKPIMAGAVMEFHHIGSTAVPLLAAKPEIDMLALIRGPQPVDVWADAFSALGYRRGGDLSAGHSFFKRDVGGVRTHKLHICVADHPMARDMLRFRDILRASPAEREAYQRLKLDLAAANVGGIQEYLHAKAPFIRKLLGS